MKKYCIDNECMLDFVEMYCEGKSRLWNIFSVGEEVILEKKNRPILFI